MIETDWLLGLAGGLVIGSAAALYLLVNGRIMGASGIIGGLIDGSGRDTALERGFFLAGLAGAPALVAAIWHAPQTHLIGDWGVLVAAGLLVGVGTRIANGCTSGHGVCGISRLSPRGIVATIVYIGAGMASVALFRHALGVI